MYDVPLTLKYTQVYEEWLKVNIKIGTYLKRKKIKYLVIT